MAGLQAEHRVTIVGAGLGGALLSNYLACSGATIGVYERRPDPRQAGFIGGRSINLAISARGIDGLRRIGLEDEIMPLALPMAGRMIHAPDGDLSYQPYDKDPARCINSISRGGLNQALVEAAERNANVRFHFARRCERVDLDRPAVTFEDESGGRSEVVSDLVIGADGAFSAVRDALRVHGRFDYSQDYLPHGYKELRIPPGRDGGFQMEPRALHIWPRGGYMMIALPNPDFSFTCTLFLPLVGPNGFDQLTGDEAVLAFFERTFRDAIPLMPDLLEDFRDNPTGNLVTIRCNPWHVGNRVALLGDASHAVVPFYGQGMNAAFEDVVALSSVLQELWPGASALRVYSRSRKRNADAIADLALRNFVEMRDHTGSALFRWQKWGERMLHKFVPGYLPLYTMVSFTTIPYADAVARERRQNRWVAGVLGVAGVIVLVLLVLLLYRLLSAA